MKIAPQPKQKEFLSSSADITIYGGAAGGGKTFAILMESIRHIFSTTGFGATIFRKNSNQITKEGGLWDSALSFYPSIGLRPLIGSRQFIAQNGNKISMAHISNDAELTKWQGTQIPLIVFDELTHFSKKTFLYMLSRNRSICGVKPYIRATTNPDSTSFVRELIDWWIDDNGFAIPERDGVIRWLIVHNDNFNFFDSEEEAYEAFPNIEPKTFTFISSKLEDNQALIDADPSYKANLMALPEFDRRQLLDGNWNVRPTESIIKSHYWCEYDIDVRIPRFKSIVMSCDTAFKANTSNDPTAITIWGVADNGYYLLYVFNKRVEYPELRQTVIDLAREWGVDSTLVEDKASGQSLIQDLRHSTRLTIYGINPEGDKKQRLSACLPILETGNVFLPNRATWLKDFKSQCELFPPLPGKGHDDMVDSMSQALNWMKNRSFEENYYHYQNHNYNSDNNTKGVTHGY